MAIAATVPPNFAHCLPSACSGAVTYAFASAPQRRTTPSSCAGCVCACSGNAVITRDSSALVRMERDERLIANRLDLLPASILAPRYLDGIAPRRMDTQRALIT